MSAVSPVSAPLCYQIIGPIKGIRCNKHMSWFIYVARWPNAKPQFEYDPNTIA